MPHYAKVINNRVVQVIVAETSDISSGMFGDPDRYIQTSYNTINGVHINPDTGSASEDQGQALRANFASIGYTYDDISDVFYAPAPFPSWVLNTEIYNWEAPTAHPTDDKMYDWNEDTLTWNETVE
jgi:hypothetical protein